MKSRVLLYNNCGDMPFVQLYLVYMEGYQNIRLKSLVHPRVICDIKICTVDIGSTGRPDSITKFEFSCPVYMIYFTEDHQYLEPQMDHLKSYFVEEFMQNEAGKFKFCDAIWPAS